MSPAMHKHNVQHPKSKESTVSSLLQPTPPWQAAVQPQQHKVAGHSSLKQRSVSRPSPESGRVQCAQKPEILPAMSIPLSEPGNKHDVATAQNLGQALGSRRNPEPRHPIAFGPALEQYVQQVEVTLAGQPAVFDEVLQVLHEYQAQDISCDVLQRQVGATLLMHHCVTGAHLACTFSQHVALLPGVEALAHCSMNSIGRVQIFSMPAYANLEKVPHFAPNISSCLQMGQLLHHHPQLVKAFQQFLPRDKATSKTKHEQNNKRK